MNFASCNRTDIGIHPLHVILSIRSHMTHTEINIHTTQNLLKHFRLSTEANVHWQSLKAVFMEIWQGVTYSSTSHAFRFGLVSGDGWEKVVLWVWIAKPVLRLKTCIEKETAVVVKTAKHKRTDMNAKDE